MSASVASSPASAFNLINPLDCNKINALPPFEGSLGIAIVAFR